MKLDIKLYPNTYKIENTIPFCLGKIVIGDDFEEVIEPAFNYWTIEDYEKQWKEGLERIKKYDTSCLVASIRNPKTSMPFLNWWLLYRKGSKIYIQNGQCVANDYRKFTKGKNFTPETCYDFIPPFASYDSDGDQYSTWEIDI